MRSNNASDSLALDVLESLTPFTLCLERIRKREAFLAVRYNQHSARPIFRDQGGNILLSLADFEQLQALAVRVSFHLRNRQLTFPEPSRGLLPQDDQKGIKPRASKAERKYPNLYAEPL